MPDWIEKNIFFGKRPYAIIIILGFLLYFQAFFFNFSYLDDNTLILDNGYFLGNLGNIFQAFQTDVFHLFNHSASYYRPLLTISFMLDYQLGATAAFIYHFTNVILHLIAVCLVFSFFIRLDYRRDLSFLFAIIFLVHPVLTQAVAWIPGRNDSLLAIFFLAFFILFLKYLEAGRQKYLWGCLIFFAAALFTKETALFSLPIIAFYLYFIKKDKKNKFSVLYFFGILIGIIGLWFFSRQLALQDSMAAMTLTNMLKSVFFNLPAVIQLTGKIFFPFNLTVLPIIQDTTFIYGIGAIFLLTLMVFFTKEKRWNFMLFGLGWFFVFLFPSFIRPNPSLVADFIEHRLYVPLIGFLILIMETGIAKKFDYKKRTSLLLGGIIICVFCAITILHSRNFSNRLVFWINAAQNSTHYPLAHRNLGAMYYLDGNYDAAEKEFQKALELNINEEMCHNNLGLIYMQRGEKERSEAEFKKELSVNPFYDAAHFNLGLLYYQTGQKDEAESFWKKTLEVNPGHVDAWRNLAVLYYGKKDFMQASQFAKEAYSRGAQLPSELMKLVEAPITPSMLLKK
jgi:protein O-mannosyl-transferase